MAASDREQRHSVWITRLANLGLAVLGLLITHQTAYGLVAWLGPALGTGPVAATDHGHQSLLMAAGGPLALWATAVFVLRQARQLQLATNWSTGQLAAAIAALYAIQESIEISLGDPSGHLFDLVTEHPALVLGLVATPAVAAVMNRLLREVTELVAAWLTVPSPAITVRSLPMVVAQRCPAPLNFEPGDPRGPPAET